MDQHLQENAQNIFDPALLAEVEACVLHPEAQCPCSCPPLLETQPDGDGHQETRPRLLVHAIAGAMCTPWSAFGKREGLSDPATEAWFIWINEQIQQAPDFITLENSPMFPLKELFVDRLKDKYVVIAAMVGPEASEPRAHEDRSRRHGSSPMDAPSRELQS